MQLNLSELLNPITEHSPCGEDYSFSNEFHRIKQARTQDDLLLDQGDWVTAPKQANWELVIETSTDLLQQHTKDIRLLTWLIEGWANLAGFEGIAKGVELSHLLLDRYWDSIHPVIEDQDLDQRLGLLQGLINQLPMLVKKVPLINTAPHYALLQYESFLYHQNIRRKQSDEYSDSDTPNELEVFEQALFNTSKSFQYQNYQSFKEILEQWHTLKQVLDTHMGLDAPSYAAIDSSLEGIDVTLRKIYKADTFDTAPSQTSSTSDQNHNDVVALEQTNHPVAQPVYSQFQPVAQSHIENREQAIRVLQQISDYFQTNEPHSPVSYMLQKTIKWSQMPLHEWLAQVIKDEHPLQQIHDALGVQTQNEYE
ncbi:type VI secretion system protein TssA [Acinetobacter soli]|uniref:type VI secretion system protein TssA n=1 Tax=Acinetobacter soli TaxID=487316 RepID=UPI001ABC0045|nr:type VI secretion system protein TssA [Acinetobacter soli]MBO3670794.1 type VI secretion system protein TssA [Acinetobacter soli]